MGFKLPRLTRDVDCEPLGYPGLVLVLWLNTDSQDWQPPQDAQPWDRYGWWQVSRIVERVIVPGDYSEDGEEQVIELPDQKAVYDLSNADGFDPAILTWAIEAWRKHRTDWLQSELGN